MCSFALQPPSPALGDRDALRALVVVAHEDTLSRCDHSSVDLKFVLELEALRADPRRAHADLDHLALKHRGLEVDLGAGEDHVLERLAIVVAEPREPSL